MKSIFQTMPDLIAGFTTTNIFLPKNNIAFYRRNICYYIDDHKSKRVDFFEQKGYKVSMSGGWGEKEKKGSGRFAYIDLSKIGGMTVELLWSFKE